MPIRTTFVPLHELAHELDLQSAAIRHWASRAHVPIFRCPGEQDALLRQRDAARLRAELGAVEPLRSRFSPPHPASAAS